MALYKAFASIINDTIETMKKRYTLTIVDMTIAIAMDIVGTMTNISIPSVVPID